MPHMFAKISLWCFFFSMCEWKLKFSVEDEWNLFCDGNKLQICEWNCVIVHISMCIFFVLCHVLAPASVSVLFSFQLVICFHGSWAGGCAQGLHNHYSFSCGVVSLVQIDILLLLWLLPIIPKLDTAQAILPSVSCSSLDIIPLFGRGGC